MNKDIRSLFSPGQFTLRDISRKYRNDSPNKKIIYKGLVAYVDRIGIDNRSRFSLKIKIYGIDNFNDNNLDNLKFYPPLFPIHLISIPEVGEEVTVICEEIGDLSNAYWIARNNNSNNLSKIDAGFDVPSNDDNSDRTGKYGTITLPKESNDISPNLQENFPTRIKPGDTVLLGRSNASIKNTFDSKNKQGLIELITSESVNNTQFFNQDFQQSNGSRILACTLADIDTQILNQINQLQFDPDYTGNKNIDSAYLLLESVKLSIISRNGKNIQHAVLGEEQSRWLVQLIDILKTTIDHIKDLTKSTSTHTHMAQGPTSPPLAPENTDFNISIPNNLDQDKNNLENQKSTIEDHHSENISLN